MRFFLVLLINTIIATLAQAQIFGPWRGTIILQDDTELQGVFSYNPLTEEELLLMRTDSTLNEYKISVVKSFHFYDPEIKLFRYFKNFDVAESGRDNSKRHFFEEIHKTDFISVLERRILKLKVHIDRFGNPVGRTKIREHYPRYLLDHRDQTIYKLSKTELIRMTKDKKDDIYFFLKSKKIHLSRENIDDYLSVINYYSALKYKPLVKN